MLQPGSWAITKEGKHTQLFWDDFSSSLDNRTTRQQSSLTKCMKWSICRSVALDVDVQK